MRIRTNLLTNAPSSVMRSAKIVPEFYFDKNYEIQVQIRDDWSECRVDLNDDLSVLQMVHD